MGWDVVDLFVSSLFEKSWESMSRLLCLSDGIVIVRSPSKLKICERIKKMKGNVKQVLHKNTKKDNKVCMNNEKPKESGPLQRKKNTSVGIMQ